MTRTSRLLLALLTSTLLLAGCTPWAGSSHEQGLAVVTEAGIVALADDDPLYDRFSAQALADPGAARAMTLYDSVISAQAATEQLGRAPLEPVIILGARESGVQRRVVIQDDGKRVRADIALALSAPQLASSNWDIPRAMGLVLLSVVGLPVPTLGIPEDDSALVSLTEIALYQGFGAALEAHYAEGLALVGLDDALGYRGAELPLHVRQRVVWLQQGAYAYSFVDAEPGTELVSSAELQRCPGAVGTFVYRLMQEDDGGFPQQYMLWFANIPPERWPEARVLLAASRMPKRDVSVYRFAQTYASTFPAQRARVMTLLDELGLNQSPEE